MGENAIQHGINSSVSGGEIAVRIKEQQGLKIIVEDKITLNEHYPRSPASKGEHIGLKNIKERLKLIYGSSANLKLETHEFGAKASIAIENARKHKNGKI